VWDPAPSPDGTRLAVTSREVVTDVVSVDPDGRGWSCLQCRVPESGWGSVAADGTLAYRRTVAGTSGLFLVEPGGLERRLTPPDEDASCPAFSPDGGRVAYLVRDDETTRLEVIARDGGPPLVLADEVEASEYPSWSPDGRFIAHAGGSPIRVRVVSAVGGTAVDLTPEGGDYPAWSPTGAWIAYSVWTDPSDPDQGAWVVSPETGDSRKIGDEPTRLAWSPDGSLIYQVRRRDDSLQLWQAETGSWEWRLRSVLDIGTTPRLHMEHLPFTVDPSTGRLVLNRRSETSSLLVYEGLDPARW
jgi:Tol biopolymer transport system component